MTPGISIRELCSEEDLESCVRILRASFGPVAEEFGFNEQTAPTNAAFTTLDNLARHRHAGLALYGMFVDSTLTGCVGIKKSKADDATYYIERLAVLPESQHLGHGTRLLQFAQETIRRSGGRRASVGVMDNNSRLKSWYLSRGFSQHDRRTIPSLPFKVCFMSLDLRAPGSAP